MRRAIDCAHAALTQTLVEAILAVERETDQRVNGCGDGHSIICAQGHAVLRAHFHLVGVTQTAFRAMKHNS